ncbi:hypothetical protein HPP92_016023 [Vanilla planifolia]|uniref:CDC20/Fizzy WD40 domain-containing protein n=1 Tax=Vanilla planifolia TaxID=51239 RepID=A0A835QND7_VANPL|nr:hypothetical protein HPP92_016023 [Vanilla planifolia]
MPSLRNSSCNAPSFRQTVRFFSHAEDLFDNMQWNSSEGSPSELLTVQEDIGPVTGVNWAPDGQHIAIGLNNSDVQLWDSSSVELLASGGNDNLVHVWDLSMSSSSRTSNENQWLHRFEGHNAAVKALAWCPFQSNLLASGGGETDRCIKFWNTLTGACLNSIDTGSQVCGLLWNRNERQLLSSHGFSENQLTLWKYPSMGKIAHLSGHTSRVLYMAQSLDGCTVATAAGDETLRFFW